MSLESYVPREPCTAWTRAAADIGVHGTGLRTATTMEASRPCCSQLGLAPAPPGHALLRLRLQASNHFVLAGGWRGIHLLYASESAESREQQLHAQCGKGGLHPADWRGRADAGADQVGPAASEVMSIFRRRNHSVLRMLL